MVERIAQPGRDNHHLRLHGRQKLPRTRRARPVVRNFQNIGFQPGSSCNKVPLSRPLDIAGQQNVSLAVSHLQHQSTGCCRRQQPQAMRTSLAGKSRDANSGSGRLQAARSRLRPGRLQPRSPIATDALGPSRPSRLLTPGGHSERQPHRQCDRHPHASGPRHPDVQRLSARASAVKPAEPSADLDLHRPARLVPRNAARWHRPGQHQTLEAQVAQPAAVAVSRVRADHPPPDPAPPTR